MHGDRSIPAFNGVLLFRMTTLQNLARNIWLNYEGRRPEFRLATTRKRLWRVRAPRTMQNHDHRYRPGVIVVTGCGVTGNGAREVCVGRDSFRYRPSDIYMYRYFAHTPLCYIAESKTLIPPPPPPPPPPESARCLLISDLCVCVWLTLYI